MKITVILLGVFFCLAHVSGRNLRDADNEESDGYTDETSHHTKDLTSRHRRRSRQSFFDYNYAPYDYRRENARQEELLTQIVRLLDEISSYTRRPPPPPPPPQPIYVPYPVPYPVTQFVPCKSNKPVTPAPPTENGTTFTVRWPDLEDDNQNWGLIPEEPADGGSDGSRPISFDPIPPKRPTVNTPPVDHGSSQAGMETTTSTPVKKPGVCQAAILSCCDYSNKDEQKSCFDRFGCNKTYGTGVACRPEVIKRVIQEFAKTYAPINES